MYDIIIFIVILGVNEPLEQFVAVDVNRPYIYYNNIHFPVNCSFKSWRSFMKRICECLVTVIKHLCEGKSHLS